MSLWTPQEGIGWGLTHFVWGVNCGACSVIALSYLARGQIWFALWGALLAFVAMRMSKNAKRPLFVAYDHLYRYRGQNKE